MDIDFRDKVAVVTGAGSGIGKATATAFAAMGACVVVADHNEAHGREVAGNITDQGQEAAFIAVDVADRNSVRNLIESTIARFGSIDFAFNNAGIEGDQAPTADCTFENWKHVIDVNLTGVWLCMKEELNAMIAHGGGVIVNCSSVAGLRGFPGVPAYVASKHGVIGLTKTAALEYARSGIRINVVCPGVIQTPMIDRFTSASPAAQDLLIEQEPIGRFGRPEEIADAVLWLCSSQASFVTGHELVVDGGMVAD